MPGTYEQPGSASKKIAPINVDLGSSSLRAKFDVVVRESGFRTTTEAVRALVRDVVEGDIQYIDGILQGQRNSPN